MKILIKNQQRHRPLNKDKILNVARTILALLDQTRNSGTELSILFIGNKKMQQLNTEYRGIKKTTDVLSFNAQFPGLKGKTENVLGDIVISVPKAESQAETAGIGFYDEICRLLIHGSLHLLGYDHEQSDYQARKMRKKEQEIFNAAQKMDREHKPRN